MDAFLESLPKQLVKQLHACETDTGRVELSDGVTE